MAESKRKSQRSTRGDAADALSRRVSISNSVQPTSPKESQMAESKRMSKRSTRVEAIDELTHEVSNSNRKKKSNRSHSAVTDTTNEGKGEPAKQDTEHRLVDDRPHHGDSANVSKGKIFHYIGMLLIFLIASAALTLAILTTFGLMNLKDEAPTPTPTSSGEEATIPPGTRELEDINAKIFSLENEGEVLERRLNEAILAVRRYKSTVDCTLMRHSKDSTNNETSTMVVEETTDTTIPLASCSARQYLSSHLSTHDYDRATKATKFRCECTGLLGLPSGEKGLCVIDYWRCGKTRLTFRNLTRA